MGPMNRSEEESAKNMAKSSLTITASVSDDSGRKHYSCSRTIYGNFTECEYNQVKSELAHLLKQTLTASFDNYILNGKDNGNDQD